MHVCLSIALYIAPRLHSAQGLRTKVFLIERMPTLGLSLSQTDTVHSCLVSKGGECC